MKIDIREFKPTDAKWVVTSHGDYYSKEYGWDREFENLVADVVFDFFKENDPSCEKAWIAEVEGKRVGSIMLTRKDEKTARLRVLYVDPKYHGHGIGSMLVKECIEFAKKCKYEQITLWTNNKLESARKIYEANGFTLEKEDTTKSFGVDFVGQYWSKSLTAEPG